MRFSKAIVKRRLFKEGYKAGYKKAIKESYRGIISSDAEDFIYKYSKPILPPAESIGEDVRTAFKEAYNSLFDEVKANTIYNKKASMVDYIGTAYACFFMGQQILRNASKKLSR